MSVSMRPAYRSGQAPAAPPAALAPLALAAALLIAATCATYRISVHGLTVDGPAAALATPAAAASAPKTTGVIIPADRSQEASAARAGHAAGHGAPHS